MKALFAQPPMDARPADGSSSSLTGFSKPELAVP
jgi:hypothetical protein